MVFILKWILPEQTSICCGCTQSCWQTNLCSSVQWRSWPWPSTFPGGCTSVIENTYYDPDFRGRSWKSISNELKVSMQLFFELSKHFLKNFHNKSIKFNSQRGLSHMECNIVLEFQAVVSTLSIISVIFLSLFLVLFNLHTQNT